MCNVAQSTVNRWVRKGLIRPSRVKTPTGQWRIDFSESDIAQLCAIRDKCRRRIKLQHPRLYEVMLERGQLKPEEE